MIHSSEYEIPFKQIYVNILIDYSYFICDENKLNNMNWISNYFCIKWFRNSLFNTLISDEKFKIILKIYLKIIILIK